MTFENYYGGFDKGIFWPKPYQLIDNVIYYDWYETYNPIEFVIACELKDIK